MDADTTTSRPSKRRRDPSKELRDPTAMMMIGPGWQQGCLVWSGDGDALAGDGDALPIDQADGAAVAGLAIASASLVAVNITGNPIFDPIGSIIVGHLLGIVAIFLIQRNRHALIGRAIDDHDMQKVMQFLKDDPVVDSVYDCKSEVIGPGFFRFKAEIDFNGVVLVQKYIERAGSEAWASQVVFLFSWLSTSWDDLLILVISLD
ncbi:hypothetical protein Dimus_003385 [Dionaea muscipula]